MTHRQFLVWQAWLEEEWENPSRTDFYLMQLEATLIDVNRTDGLGTDVNKRKISFKPKKPLSKDSLMMAAKRRKAQIMEQYKGKVTVIEVDKPQQDL